MPPSTVVDSGLRNELVAVDASVDRQSGDHDGGIAPGPGQALGVQGDLKGARDPEEFDPARVEPEVDDLLEERIAAAVDHGAVPLGLDESDPHGGVCLRLTTAQVRRKHAASPGWSRNN